MTDLISREAAIAAIESITLLPDDECWGVAVEALRAVPPFVSRVTTLPPAKEAAPASDMGNPISGGPVTLTYRNWRGEVAERTITPRRVWFGSTDWHPEPQWLLTAWDAEKQAERDFALADFGQPAAPAVNVKPLEWETTPWGHEVVQTPWGRYFVGRRRDGWVWCWNDSDAMADTEEAAKAAAQADYEARILAALEGGEA